MKKRVYLQAVIPFGKPLKHYKVVEARNTIVPQVGSTLSKLEVSELIDLGTEVWIKPYK